MDLEKYTIEDATHLLDCRSCRGNGPGQCREYTMKCIPISTTPSGKMRIIVFGYMFWKDQDHIKNIRYVDSDRVYKIK